MSNQVNPLKCNIDELFTSSVQIDYSIFPKSINRNSYTVRMKKMAIEVTLSYVTDILSLKKIKKYLKVINNIKSSYKEKNFAQLMLDRHYKSVDWFCSGEACESIWFEILDMHNIGIEKMITLVHKKIEGWV